MKILVTGTPGSGKTTLVKYAIKQGSKLFVDADDVVGLCEWRDFSTSAVVGLVSEFLEDGTDEFYRKYGWYWNEIYFKNLIRENGNIVICGSSENIVSFYDFFDLIYVLKKSETELVDNLKSSERSNPYGKTTIQRQSFMEWQKYLLNSCQNFKHKIIEGNDVSDIYGQILKMYEV